MGSQHGQRYRQIVDRIEALLRSDRGEQLHVDDLCRVAAVSERTLRNAFRKVHGVSPYRFLRGFRMTQARQALMAGRRAARHGDRSRDAVRISRARPVFGRLPLRLRRMPVDHAASRRRARRDRSAGIRLGRVPSPHHEARQVRRPGRTRRQLIKAPLYPPCLPGMRGHRFIAPTAPFSAPSGGGGLVFRPAAFRLISIRHGGLDPA